MDLGKKRGSKTLHSGDRISTYLTTQSGRNNKYRYTRSHLTAGTGLVIHGRVFFAAAAPSLII